VILDKEKQNDKMKNKRLIEFTRKS